MLELGVGLCGKLQVFVKHPEEEMRRQHIGESGAQERLGLDIGWESSVC